MSDRLVYVTPQGHHWIVRKECSRPKLFATLEAAIRAVLLLVEPDEPIDIRI